MALIETRSRVFSVGIEPVLNERAGIESRTTKGRGIVHRLRQRVLRRRGKASAETMANLALAGMTNRSAVRCEIAEPGRARRTWIRRACRVRVRQELLHQVRAAGAEV